MLVVLVSIIVVFYSIPLWLGLVIQGVYVPPEGVMTQLACYNYVEKTKPEIELTEIFSQNFNKTYQLFYNAVI